ncbi:DUF4209 domain-containing protein [Herbaspirillum chlorophenolicum]|uniref:DUF4209 domain-containing protein n=3 Tax=Herbaspirillum chlorophenolicum TaxID=211589 RepID=UPI000B195E6B|nr:DUF4209 domain-containing protein [Herbaspirillum chlorophenolicum]
MAISAQQLKSLDLDNRVALQTCGDYFALEKELEDAAKASEAAGDQNSMNAFRLLSHICTFSMRTNEGDPFTPRFIIDGRRSPMPIDYTGEQTTQFSEATEFISPPLLQARVADTVWYNDRSKWQIALIAISAYFESIRLLLSKAIRPQFEPDNDIYHDAFDYFERGLEIAAQANKKNPFPQVLVDTFEVLYQRTKESPEFIGFSRMAEIGGRSGLRTWEQIANDAFGVATQADERKQYPAFRQRIWEVAATAYKRIKDKDQERLCRIKVADSMLAMRSCVTGAGAQASWTMDAIGYLRDAGGFQKRTEELTLELRALQVEALEEMVTFEYPMDLSEEWQEVQVTFADLTLSQALRLLVGLVPTPQIKDLDERARKSQESFLFSQFGSHHLDDKGKVISVTPSAKRNGELDEKWLKDQRSSNLSFDRKYLVGSRIEPARRIFAAKFPVGTYCFDPIISASPFVPPGHEFLYSLGFSSFFQGDYIRAAHVLIPQLEASLRHLLEAVGTPSEKIKPDMLQEDRSLSGMLTSMRPQIEQLFGPDLTEEIDLLFNHKPGPSLRHELAHGKITTGHCFHDDVIYACWWMYRMVATPLLKHWNEIVEHSLARSEGST